MQNCHVEELLNVITHIFQDACDTYPTLEGEFEKDLVRLRRCVEQRGIHVLTVDLPAIAKHLDRCLDNGQYIFAGIPLTKRVSTKVRVPKFLRQLYLLVFDTSGRLKDDCDTEAVLFLRQILYVGKKAKLYCGDAAVRAEVREFQVVDASLPVPEQFWDNEVVSHSDARIYEGFSKSPIYASRVRSLPAEKRDEASIVLTYLDIVSNKLVSSLGVYDYERWRFRHGPGAVSETVGPSNKFYWQNWSNRLENVYPIARVGFHSYASWAGHVEGRNIGSFEPTSRLIDVPKTFTKPRLIAVEPSEHQWCQQNIWHYFCSRVQSSWVGKFIRFRDQTLNQELCSRGSRDGSLATIDLSAASDRVTCHAVGQLFRSNTNLLLALQASRTRKIAQDQVPGMEPVIELRKFSTMGNACTFPVQSLMFLSVVLTSILVKRGRRPTVANIRELEGEVAVFGDDLIVPVDSRELVADILEVLHFKVNANKSYWTGRFRESCGVDSFRGVNVTPVYWRSPVTSAPESVASTVDVCNNFKAKFLLHSSAYLASTLPRQIRLPNVAADSGVMGLKSFVPRSNEHLKTRYNPVLQRMESLVPQLSAKVKKTPVHDDTGLLQYFTEDPEPTTKWTSGVAQRPKLRMQRVWVPSYLLNGDTEERN